MTAKIEEQVVLAPLTTIRLGGTARYLWYCRSVRDLKEALAWARDKRLPWHVLSGGSNTIFLDEGFSGVIIKIELMGIDWGKDGRVTIAAGEVWEQFVEKCVQENLAGVECLSGIPGLAGATPIQNVGAYGQEVAQTITAVHVLEVKSMTEKIFSNSDCRFSYRWSRFKGGDAGKYIVTAVEFQLRPGGEATIEYAQVRDALTTPPLPSPHLKGGELLLKRGGETEGVTLRDVRDVVLSLRRKKSMVLDETDPNTHSCGSFFENVLLKDVPDATGMPTFQEIGIPRVPSAWLIEQAGFPKGFRRGGVGISLNHNLALVNYGGTTKELLGLANEIQVKVKEKFGVDLKREPVVVR